MDRRCVGRPRSPWPPCRPHSERRIRPQRCSSLRTSRCTRHRTTTAARRSPGSPRPPARRRSTRKCSPPRSHAHTSPRSRSPSCRQSRSRRRRSCRSGSDRCRSRRTGRRRRSRSDRRRCSPRRSRGRSRSPNGSPRRWEHPGNRTPRPRRGWLGRHRSRPATRRSGRRAVRTQDPAHDPASVMARPKDSGAALSGANVHAGADRGPLHARRAPLGLRPARHRGSPRW